MPATTDAASNPLIKAVVADFQATKAEAARVTGCLPRNALSGSADAPVTVAKAKVAATKAAVRWRRTAVRRRPIVSADRATLLLLMVTPALAPRLGHLYRR